MGIKFLPKEEFQGKMLRDYEKTLSDLRRGYINSGGNDQCVIAGMMRDVIYQRDLLIRYYGEKHITKSKKLF